MPSPALFRRMVSGARSLGHSAGQRALAGGSLATLGAAGGAGVGAARGALDDSGEGTILQRSLRGAVSGAGTGALLGGAAGALGGSVAQKAVRGLSEQKNVAGALSRFGERQVHGLTGALPAGMTRSKGLEAIGASPLAAVRETFSGLGGTPKWDSAGASLGRAAENARVIEELGATSVPGLFKALATKPMETTKALAGYQWNSAPTALRRGMALGLPAASIVGSHPQGDDTKTTTMLSAAGSTLPYLTPIGAAGQIALSGALRSGGKNVGRAITGTKQYAPQEPPPPPVDASAGNAERVYSSRITGDF